MRWDALRLDTDGVGTEPGDEAGQNSLPLPLAGQGARVRTFDTPEFRGMTFFEVRAKSVLNRVPGASQVPFEWTVNPYRGCSHACVYCLTGDTAILLADGRTRPLADIRPGDRIYGTEVRDGRRRYVVTEVLAHWRTVKPAYRVVLEDGTELVASGDHRFLTRRGWKHVTGAVLRRGVRPHLTRKDELVGFGRSAAGLKLLLGAAHPTHRSRRPASHLGVTARAHRQAGATALHGDHPSCLHHPAGRAVGPQPEAEPEPIVPRSRRAPTVDDIALRGGARLRVTAIEPLGMLMPMYDITTGTGDFVANGVVSHNCFARRTHTYLDLDAGADFDSRVVVKVNTAEALRHDLAAPTWRRAHVAMGTNVDCYQRAEGRYQLMPGVIAALRDFRTPFSILTKGTLLLRDLPRLVEAATEVSVSLNVSVGSVDRRLWRSVEPGTPAPQARLRMVRAIRDAGLDCGVLMGPVIPYLSDSPQQLDQTVAAIAEAGATRVSAIPLHLRPGAREWFMEWLQREHPTLVPAYHRLFRGGSYAPVTYREGIGEQVRSLAAKHGIGETGADRGRWMGEPTEPPPEPPTQLSLI